MSNIINVSNDEFNIWVNTYLSKTFKRNHPMYMRTLPMLVDLTKYVLSYIKYPYNVKEEVNPEWGHRCGAPPRWIRVKVKLGSLTGYHSPYHYVPTKIDVFGGGVWRMRIIRKPSETVVITDGCWDIKSLVSSLEDFIKQAEEAIKH